MHSGECVYFKGSILMGEVEKVSPYSPLREENNQLFLSWISLGKVCHSDSLLSFDWRHPAWHCLLLIPITKHTAPILLAFVAIWQIHVDTANIHLFRHIMSRNREQLELCLLLLLMRMGEGGRERERNHLTIRDIQLIMSHMCL